MHAHRTQNLTSRFLIAMRQQQAVHTAKWVEARGESSLASILHVQLSLLPLFPAPPRAATATVRCHFQVRPNSWLGKEEEGLMSCHIKTE